MKASVFAMQGFLDGAVKPDNHGDWFHAVPTQKKAWLGFWYHQYPTASNAGREDMFLTIHRWLDQELKGIDNGIGREPAIDVQDSLGRWRHEDAWPPADARPHVLQLSADGALVEGGAEAGEVAFGGPVALVDVVRDDGTGRAVFGHLAMTKPLHIAGAPTLNVTLASDRPAGILVARLYDGERMVTQGAFNLLFAGGLDAPRPLSPREPVTIGFALYPTDWVATDALRLELTTQDPTLWFDNEGTLATLTLQAGESATLTLPLIERGEEAFFLTSCGRALKENVDGCWKDLDDLGVEDG